MKNSHIENVITIEDLLKNIVDMASVQLREHGEIQPTFICLGSQRIVRWTVQSLSNDSAVNEFVKDCRLLCVAEESSVAIFAAQTNIGSGVSPTIKLSGASTNGGQECLLIQIEAGEGQSETHLIPIIPQAGAKSKLGVSRVILQGLLAGITNEILPRTRPTEAGGVFAKFTLEQNLRVPGYHSLQSN